MSESKNDNGYGMRFKEYLSYEEYQQILSSAVNPISKEEYQKYVPLMTTIINDMTMDYYELHNLDEEQDRFKWIKFKQACAYQIMSLIKQEFAGSVDAKHDVEHVVAGKTQYSFNTNLNGAGGSGSSLKAFYDPEAEAILHRTNLLYRGMHTVDHYSNPKGLIKPKKEEDH